MNNVQTLKETAPEEIQKDIVRDDQMPPWDAGGQRQATMAAKPARGYSSQLINVMIERLSIRTALRGQHITGQLSSELSVLLIELIENRFPESPEI